MISKKTHHTKSKSVCVEFFTVSSPFCISLERWPKTGISIPYTTVSHPSSNLVQCCLTSLT